LLRSSSKLVSISIADKMSGSNPGMSTRDGESDVAASILPRSQSKSILFVNSPSKQNLSSPNELEAGRRNGRRSEYDYTRVASPLSKEGGYEP
jgi:hypothetical protein